MISVTKKEIKDCLLGKYDAEKESEFLASCFSDDENTEKFEIVRQDLIESYLRGILSKEEKNLFEENFLKDAHNRELLSFAETLRNHLSENKQLAEIVAKPEKKPFAFGNLLIPIGGLAVLAIISFLVWQVFLKRDENDIVQASPTPTPPTEQVSPTPTVSSNQTVSPLPANNSNIANSSANKTLQNNATDENPDENPSERKNVTQQNPDFAAIKPFRLPIGLMGDEEILIINKYNKIIKIEIPFEMIKNFLSQPENKFPKYNIKILPFPGNRKEIYRSKDFDSEKFPKNLNVQAYKFKKGNYKFVITGISADGGDKVLDGLESRFQVKIIKK